MKSVAVGSGQHNDLFIFGIQTPTKNTKKIDKHL